MCELTLIDKRCTAKLHNSFVLHKPFSDAICVSECCTVSMEYISSSIQLSFDVHEKSIKSQLTACTKNVHEFAF